MRERPILMSAPMVMATLNGTKTQTRRIVKGAALDLLDLYGFAPKFTADPENRLCPYGLPGDQLWVRETWQRAGGETGYWYAATDGQADDGASPVSRWRPSIHMPRAASRISLGVTRVRIDRLQEISEADALAEGIDHDPGEGGVFHVRGLAGCCSDTAIGSYRKLWEQINGPDSWAANPWVWAIDFKRITP